MSNNDLFSSGDSTNIITFDPTNNSGLDTSTLPDYSTSLPTSVEINALSNYSSAQLAGQNTVLPIIYGTDRVFGKIITAYISNDGQTLYLMVGWCQGLVQGIITVYVDSVDITATNGLLNASTPGSVTHYLGTATQGVDTTMASIIAGYSDTMPNVCYSVFKIPAGATNGFPQVEAIINGKLVYDPRLETRASNYGLNLNNPAFKYFSSNPTLCFADLMVNQAKQSVNWASIAASAYANDALIAGDVSRQMGLALISPTSVGDLIKLFRVYMGAFIVWEGSVLRVIPDKDEGITYLGNVPTGVSAFITPDDIVKDSVRITQISPRDLPNSVSVEYRDSSTKDWRIVRVTQETAAVTAGTATRRFTKVSLPGIKRYSQAAREAFQRLGTYQSTITIELSVFDIGLNLQVGSIIALTYSQQTNVLYRVLQIKGGNGIWNLVLSLYSSSFYPNFSSTAVLNQVYGKGNVATIGGSAVSLQIQYSPDAGTWHDPPWIPATDQYMRQKLSNATLWSAPMQIVGVPGANGSPALVGDLSVPSVVLTSDAAGNVTSYGNGTGKFYVFLGTTDVSSSCVFAKTGDTGGTTTTINASTGVYTVSGLAAGTDSALVTFSATYLGGTVITLSLSISKAKAGSAGATSPLLKLAATSQIFSFDSTGAASPAGQSITFSYTGQNLSAAVSWIINAYASNGSLITPAPTLTFPTGSTANLTIANFGSAASVVVQVTAGAIQDQITVVGLKSGATGASAFVGFLTNEASVVASDFEDSPVVGALATATGSFLVFLGTTQVTSGVTYSIGASSGVLSPAITSAGVYTIGGLSQPTSYVNFIATYGTYSVTKTFTIAKARQGYLGPTLWTPVLTNVKQLANSNFQSTVVTSAWGPSIISKESYSAAFISIIVDRATDNKMIGLTQTQPNGSYTFIDYALYLTVTGKLQAYIGSGGTTTYDASFASLSISYTVGDSLSMTYDGDFVRILKNGVQQYAYAAPSKRFYGAAAFNTGSSSFYSLNFGIFTNGRNLDNNLLHTQDWRLGTTGTQGNFVAYAVAGSNSIVKGGASAPILGDGSGFYPLGPYKTSEFLWLGLGGNSVAGNSGYLNIPGESGAPGDIQGIDPTRTYRSCVWFRYEGSTSNGYFYFGADPFSKMEIYNGTGAGAVVTNYGNNYFFYHALPGGLVAGRWYLAVGVIFGSTYTGPITGSVDICGIWDPTTGKRIVTGGYFRQLSTWNSQGQCAFLYDSTYNTNVLYLARPRFEPMDGREPSIPNLLSPSGLLSYLDQADTDNIAQNAASQTIVVVSAAGSSVLSGAGGTSPADTDVVSGSITTKGGIVSVDLSGYVYVIYAFIGAGYTVMNSPSRITIRRDGTNVGTAYFDLYNAIKAAPTSSGSNGYWYLHMSFTISDIVSAGTYTYAAHIHQEGTSTSGGGILATSLQNVEMKVREYRR